MASVSQIDHNISCKRALEAACAAITATAKARLSSNADSPVADRIIANNPLAPLGHGFAGCGQVFLSLLAPSVSELKRRAAEMIQAHRRMRACGGGSNHWLDRAAKYRAEAYRLACREADDRADELALSRTLLMAAE